MSVADHVTALCWMADPANVDPGDDLLHPGVRERIVAKVAAELSHRLDGATPLASVATLKVIYLGFALEAQASAVGASVGARLAQLVAEETARRVPDGHLFDTMPTDDLVELLAGVDTWTARGLRNRRNAMRRRLGAVLDRRLGLA